MSQKINLNIKKNNNFYVLFTYNVDGMPVDFTNYTIDSKLYDSTGTDVVVPFSVALANNGRLILSIPQEDVDVLNNETVYTYKVTLTDVNMATVMPFYGDVLVYNDFMTVDQKADYDYIFALSTIIDQTQSVTLLVQEAMEAAEEAVRVTDEALEVVGQITLVTADALAAANNAALSANAALTHSLTANTHANTALTYRNQANASAVAANTHANTALTYRNQANSSAQAAASSASAANGVLQETLSLKSIIDNNIGNTVILVNSANASAVAAANSAGQASISATAAANSANAALTHSITADTHANTALTHRNAANVSAVAAANSAEVAFNHQDSANTFKNQAQTYSISANNSAAAANLSANNAAASAAAANVSANNAVASASAAATSASQASGNATAAATSASRASGNATAAATSASQAAANAASANNAQTLASGYAAAANVSANNAAASAAAANASATAAATSASQAAGNVAAIAAHASAAQTAATHAAANVATISGYASSAQTAASQAAGRANEANNSAIAAANSANLAYTYMTMINDSGNTSLAAANDALTYRNQANASAIDAANSASQAAANVVTISGFRTSAQTAATQAAANAASANTFAGQAAANAAAALGSATSASTSAGQASSNATAAATSATAAAANAVSANTFKNQAQTFSISANSSAAAANVSANNAAASATAAAGSASLANTYMNQAKGHAEAANTIVNNFVINANVNPVGNTYVVRTTTGAVSANNPTTNTHVVTLGYANSAFFSKTVDMNVTTTATFSNYIVSTNDIVLKNSGARVIRFRDGSNQDRALIYSQSTDSSFRIRVHNASNTSQTEMIFKQGGNVSWAGANIYTTSNLDLSNYVTKTASLTAISGVTPATDQFPYFTSGTTAAAATLSAFGRSLIDDTDATQARATLGAQANLGYTPANKAGDTFTGWVTINGDLTLNAGSMGAYMGGGPAGWATAVSAGFSTSYRGYITYQYANGDQAYSYLVVQDGSISKDFRIGTSGNAWMPGTLYAASKSFLIDHPLLPNEKDLRHVAIEAPEFQVRYRGRTTLSEGLAVINIDIASRMTPGTFVKLAGDAAVYAAMPVNSFERVMVSEVIDGEFTITSENNESTIDVVWEVVARRIDPFVYTSDETDDNGIYFPEVDKPE